jgi:Ca2+-binding RTX toxin-like protein
MTGGFIFNELLASGLIAQGETAFSLAHVDDMGRLVRFDFSGTGFAAYENGFPTTGTITDLAYSVNDVVVFTLSGMSESAADFFSDLLTNPFVILPRIFGSADEITGSTQADSLQGFGGDDLISAGAGDDDVTGDDGDDQIDLGDGFDFAFGDAGNDEIHGGAGNDHLNGEVTGELAGDDQLFGGDGDDFMRGGLGNDFMDGGAGSDRVSYTAIAGGVTVDLRIQGVAQDTGAGGVDTLVDVENVSGSQSADVLIGDDQANWIWGNGGADSITGHAGDDTIRTSEGDGASVDGGDGVDVISFTGRAFDDTSTTGVTINLGVQGSAQDTMRGLITLNSIEGAEGSEFDDSIQGNSGANILSGRAGADVINGLGGDDLIQGDIPLRLVGEIPFDFNDPSYNHGDDVLSGGDGADQIFGNRGDDTIDGGYGDDVMDGGEGIDTVSYATGGNGQFGVVVNLANSNPQDTSTTGVDTLIAIENLTGSIFDDLLIGDSGANVLRGGDGGQDRLFGSGGDDSLFGEWGNDTLSGGAGADLLDGGEDRDIASYAAPVAVSLALQGVAQDTGGEGLDTLVSIEILAGSSFADTLTGSSLDDELRGMSGDDTLFGGDGDDVLYGADFDTFIAGDGADTLHGEAGDDSLLGGAGDDVLLGGAGDDGIEGSGGADLMDGGDGNDHFLVGDSFGTGVDTIHGGSGIDELFYWSAPESVVVQLGAGYAATGGGMLLHTFSGIENVIGTVFGDALIGDAANNLFTDGFGGGGGADWMVGGAGDDQFQLFETQESGGVDRIFGDDGFDTIDYNGYIHVTGAGIFGVTVQLAFGYATSGGDLIETFTGIEAAVGTSQDDALIGTDADNHLTGHLGDDWIVGGDGDDTFFQTVVFIDEVDRLFGGTPGADSGFDTIDYSPSLEGVIVQLTGYATRAFDGGLLATFSGIEAAVGTIADDALIGTAGDNRLEGGQGADWLVGGAGNDTFVQGVDASVDRIFGDAGTDTLDYSGAIAGVTVQLSGYSAVGGATLATFTGIENAVGSNFADALIGDNGDNRITGGGGADWLVGAAGADTFVYQSISDGPGDSIRDFAQGADRIDLSAIDADPTTGGDDLFAFATVRHAGVVGEAVVTNFGASSLVSLYLDADDIADMTIQVVHEPGLVLNASDFML